MKLWGQRRPSYKVSVTKYLHYTNDILMSSHDIRPRIYLLDLCSISYLFIFIVSINLLEPSYSGDSDIDDIVMLVTL